MYKSKVDNELWQDVDKGIENYEIKDINKMLTDMARENYSLATIPETFALKYPMKFCAYAIYRTSLKPAEISFIPTEYILKFPDFFSNIAEKAMLRNKNVFELIKMTLMNAKDETKDEHILKKLNYMEKSLQKKHDREK